MSKNVVFLLHGVGRHSENWAHEIDGPIATLEEAAKNYAFFGGRKFSDLVDVEPIYVDDIFDRILKQWNDAIAGLKGAGGAPDALKAVLSLCEKATDGDKDLIAYGADVPLYRGFPLFAKRIQLAVNLRIARIIAEKSKARDGELPHYIVIAHSLGTAMAHDSLHLLGTEDWLNQDYSGGPADAGADAAGFEVAHRQLVQRYGTANPFAPGFVDFRSVYMVSNTSRLLQTICAPDKSLVCPIPRGSSGAYCQSFFNIDHKLDPISKVMPFRVPTAWEEKGGGHLELDHLYDLNVHGFSHYLRHPDVHRNIFMDAIDGFEPSDAENDSANNFPAFGGSLEAAVATRRDALRERLQTVVASALSEATGELDRFLTAYQAIREIAQRGV